MSKVRETTEMLLENGKDMLIDALDGLDSLTNGNATRAVSAVAGLSLIAKAGDVASTGEPWNDFLLATGGAALLAIAGRGPKALLNILRSQGEKMGTRTPGAADLRNQEPLPPNRLRI